MNKNSVKLLLFFIAVTICSRASLNIWADIDAAGPSSTIGTESHNSVSSYGSSGINTAIALLPFHCRAEDKYSKLGNIISIIISEIFSQTIQADLLERTHIEKIFSEKVLAQTGLADNTALIAKGQTAGADFIISGNFDVIDDELVIKAEIVPSQNSDFSKVFQDIEADFKEVKAQGDISNPITVIETLGHSLCKTFVARQNNISPGKQQFKYALNKAVAVYDFTYMPQNEKTASIAQAVSDMMSIDMQEVLPLKVVERQNLYDIIHEHKLQLSGLTNRSQALEIGKLIGADYLLLGSVVNLDSVVRINSYILDAASGLIVASASHIGNPGDVMMMQKRLALDIAQNWDVNAGRLKRLHNRKIAGNPEAVTHAARSKFIAYHPQQPLERRVSQSSQLMNLALELDSENDFVQHYAGSVAWKFSSFDLAEKHLRYAYKLAPESAWHNNSLARFLREIRKSPFEALGYAVQSVHLSPESYWQRRLELAKCYFELELYDQAEQECQTALLWDKGPDTCLLAARISEKLQKYSDAAVFYQKSTTFSSNAGCDHLRKSVQLWRKSSNLIKSMQALEILVERGLATADEQLQLAEYLITSNPVRAKMLYRSLAVNSNQSIKEKAVSFLTANNISMMHSLPSYPVFDISALRKQGVIILLQPYESYRYQSQLPHLKENLQNALGIPVEISSEIRSIPRANYIKAIDVVSPDDLFLNDLKQAQQKYKAYAVIGLLSIEIKKYKSHLMSYRWPERQCVLISTKYFQRPATDSDQLPAAEVISKLRNVLLKNAALIVLPAERSQYQSVYRHCPLSVYPNPDISEKNNYLCDECRQYLQTSRIKWPKYIKQ